MTIRLRWATLFFAGVLLFGGVFIIRLFRNPVRRGISLNQKAWEASYRERWRPVPKQGPREGFWGARLKPKSRDKTLAWRESPIDIPGLVTVDDQGLQHYAPSKTHKHKILFLGGSVAWGAYASTVQNTYFHIVGDALSKKSLPVRIDVFASGAWKSLQELRALERAAALRPDVIVFLNGLNDLTNGATSRTLFGQPVATKDGSEWTILYHAHDYRERVQDYLENMKKASDIARRMGSRLLIVLQPALFEKENRTPIEEKLLMGSLRPHASLDVLVRSYDDVRKGLAQLAETPPIYFLDASRLYNKEEKTIFSDIWHFSDMGHRMLGEAIAEKLLTLLAPDEARI